VPVGLWLGSLAPWVDRETLGPLVLGNYVYAYVVLALPISLPVLGAVLRADHAHPFDDVDLRRPHRPLVLRSVFAVVLSKPGLEHVAALWNLRHVRLRAATRYWTASERNALMPPIAGDLLWNKVLWLGVGCGALALATTSSASNPPSVPASDVGSRCVAAADANRNLAVSATDLGKPSFGAGATRAQLWARTRLEARQVFLSLPISCCWAWRSCWRARPCGFPRTSVNTAAGSFRSRG